MLDRIKEAAVRALRALKSHVWTLLLVAFPFADQIIAGAEAQLPVLAPYLGSATYKWMGLLIVAAKFALQLYRGWQQFGVMLNRKTFEG